jgi:hypothetical protein
MKNVKRWLVAGGAAALAGAVWLPSLIGRTSEIPGTAEVGAEGEASIMPASLSAFPGAPEPDAPTEALDQGSGLSMQPGSIAAATGSAQESMEDHAAASDRRGVELAGLLASLRAQVEPGGNALEAAASAGSRTGASLLSEQNAREHLDAFVAGNLLRGVIHGEDSSLAVLGHRVVRPGDRVAGGTIEVLEIGPDWLMLGISGVERVVDLEPFQAAPSVDSSAPSPAAEGAATIPAGPSPPPAAAPAQAGGQA